MKKCIVIRDHLFCGNHAGLRSTFTNTQLQLARESHISTLGFSMCQSLAKVPSAHKAPRSLRDGLCNPMSLVTTQEMNQGLHLGDTSHLMLCLLGACLQQDHGAGCREESRQAEQLLMPAQPPGTHHPMSLLTT